MKFYRKNQRLPPLTCYLVGSLSLWQGLLHYFFKDLTSIVELTSEKHRTRLGLFPFIEFTAQIVKSLMLYYHASLIPYVRVLDVIREAAIAGICFNTHAIEELAELMDVNPVTVTRWWRIFRDKAGVLMMALTAYASNHFIH